MLGAREIHRRSELVVKVIRPEVVGFTVSNLDYWRVMNAAGTNEDIGRG